MNTYQNYIHKQTQPKHQTEQDRPDQVQNNAGGYAFKISDVNRLNRFLILGTTGGTYYCSEKEYTKDNLDFVISMIKLKGISIVEEALRVSEGGLSPKQSPFIITLALCFVHGDNATKHAASKYFNRIIRTGKQLLEFVGYVKSYRSLGRLVRTTISNWYNNHSNLPLQVTKYRNNNTSKVSSHDKVLKLAHIKPKDNKVNTLFNWVLNKNEITPEIELEMSDKEYFRLPLSLHCISKSTTEESLLNIIRLYSPTMDMIPTTRLSEEVYKELIPNLPLNTLLRNINNISRKGIINGDIKDIIIDKFSNKEAIQKARLHPLNILLASLNFKDVNSDIRTVVDNMFIDSFKECQPINKKISLNFDVSGSMKGSMVNGSKTLNAISACAAYGLVLKKLEKTNIDSYQFDHTYTSFDLRSDDNIESVIRKATDRPFGNTDCSLPMTYATKNNIYYDCFIVMTDNETWYGSIHPYQALKEYRKKVNKNAKLIVLATSSTEFSIADPNDTGMLDICGFSSDVFQVINSFLSEEI